MDIAQLLEAQAAELRRLSGAVSRLAPEAAPVAVRELWEAFAAAQRDELASWRDYVQRWRDHVGPAFGDLDAGAVAPGEVDAYRARRTGDGAAIATVNREIALLRRVVNFGVRRGRIAKSRLHGPGMTRDLIHREDNVRATVVEETGARVTFEAFAGQARPMLRAYLTLVYDSGMRRKEASLLLWDRITGDVAWLPGRDTKGGRSGRYVPVSSRAAEALAELPRKWPHVFANPRTGLPYCKDYWTHAFGKLVRRLGLAGPDGPPWLHDLRRSFVTLSRRRGEPQVTVKRISGHLTESVFLRYDVSDPRDVLDFRERAELARAAELREPRRPPQRADAKKRVDVAIGPCDKMSATQ